MKRRVWIGFIIGCCVFLFGCRSNSLDGASSSSTSEQSQASSSTSNTSHIPVESSNEESGDPEGVPVGLPEGLAETIGEELEEIHVGAFSQSFLIKEEDRISSSILTYHRGRAGELILREGDKLSVEITDYLQENPSIEQIWVSEKGSMIATGYQHALGPENAYLFVAFMGAEAPEKNPLYELDMEAKTFEAVAEPLHQGILLPVCYFNEQVVTIEIDPKGEGDYDSFLEILDESNNFAEVEIDSASLYPEYDLSEDGGKWKHNFRAIDCDEESLYLLEELIGPAQTDYYIVKYDKDFQPLERIEISNVLRQSGIFGVPHFFEAYQDCIYIRDPFMMSLIGHLEGDELVVDFISEDHYEAKRIGGNHEYLYFFIPYGEIEILAMNVETKRIGIATDAFFEESEREVKGLKNMYFTADEVVIDLYESTDAGSVGYRAGFVREEMP